MKSKIPKWIILDGNSGEAVCLRCGDREAPRLPMPIDAFLKWGEYIGLKHKFCEEKKP